MPNEPIQQAAAAAAAVMVVVAVMIAVAAIAADPRDRADDVFTVVRRG